MGNLEFDITLENEQFLRGLKEAQNAMKKTVATVENEGASIDKVFDRIKTMAAASLAGFSAKEFVSKMVSVRGEMQQLQVAFETMLGSAQKASDLMEQLVHTAAVTPFGLEDVSNGARQLLAYGTEAEKVNATLIKLGDIAAGLSMPLNDLVYLYGTTMTQGRLYTQDLNQFTGRGIPMIQELAKQFGVAESKVKELVEAGKVGFPEVEKVIDSLTGEGSKFGGLMEEQSKTITGQIANIEDAIDMMFNNLGQQSEGVINGVLEQVSYIVEHYEQFGRILLGVTATWGTYRTAVMLAAATTGWASAAEAVHYNWLLLIEKAQKLLNATMLANPYILVATAAAGMVAVMASMKTETEQMQAADEAYEAEKQKVIEAEEEHRRRIEELTSVAGDESLSTDTRRGALVKLIQQYPSIFEKYKTEYDMLKNIRDIKQEIALLDGKGSVTKAGNELQRVNAKIAELERKKGTSTLTMSGATVGGLQMAGLSTQEEAELKALKRRREKLASQTQKDAANAYLQDLTGVSNKDLEKQIKERENLLAKMKTTGHQKGYVTAGGARGSYTKDELEGQLQLLKAEQGERKAERKTGAGWTSEDKKAYEKALKEYNDFVSDTTTKLTKAEREERLKELEENLKAAEAAYNGSKPKTNKAANKNASDAKKQADAQTKAQEEINKALLSLMQQNTNEEISLMSEGTEKKIAEIRNSYKKQVAEIDRQEAEFKKKNKEAEVKTGSNGLTAEQENALQKARELAQKQSDQEEADVYKEENKARTEAMQDFLKQYGDYEEKRLALTQEYEAKITAAKTEGERMSLKLQMNDALKEMDADELKKSINWEDVFNNISYMTVEQLKGVKSQLQSMMSDGTLKVDEYKSAAEQIQKINEAIFTAQDSTKAALGLVLPHVQERKRLEQDVADAIEAQNRALESQNTANADLATKRQELADKLQNLGLDISLGDVKTSASQSIMDEVGDIFGSDSDIYKDLQKRFENLAVSEQNVTEANSKREESEKRVTDAQDKLNKFLSDLSEKLKGIQEVLDLVSANVGSLPDFFENLGVDMDSSFGKGVQSLAGAAQSASSALSDLANGNFVGAAANSVSAIKGLWSGMGSILTGSGESDKHLSEDLEDLTASNEALKNSIDALAEKMEDATSMGDITDYYEQQKKNLAQAEANTQEMMYRSADAHVRGNLFRSRKKGSYEYVNGAMSAADWKQVSAAAGVSINDARDFFKLTSEQMAAVAEQAPALYAKIKEYASKGYADAGQYMDTYIEYGKQLEELEKEYREYMTSISFDSVKDEFKSMLQDMDSDSEDFANNLEDMLRNAVINSLMVDKYNKMLEDWYESFSDAMESGGALTDDEVSALREQYNTIAANALYERDALLKTLGISGSSSSQEASSGGWESMGQETADELNGRFTALQIAGETIATQVTSVLTNLESLTSVEMSTNGAALEIRNMMVMANSYLEDIAKYAKNTYNDFGVKMDTMITKLKEI